ncbi:hypothetical protein L1887_44306 [Cichorium endivia]|nr:hypothetical protein L1887_44306 [Cichorium endivia]
MSTFGATSQSTKTEEGIANDDRFISPQDSILKFTKSSSGIVLHSQVFKPLCTNSDGVKARISITHLSALRIQYDYHHYTAHCNTKTNHIQIPSH